MDDLEDALDGAGAMTAEFARHLEGLRGALAGAGEGSDALSRSMSRSLRGAFDEVAFSGGSLREALRGVARSMADTVYAGAMKPVTDHFGGMLSDAVGGLVGGLVPFAKGGVVGGPVAFPMRGGAGLMGEAGPEAILPLARGADGSLGVRAGGGGGGPAHVTVNVSTPDAGSFLKSRSQVAAAMQRAARQGRRNG
ncbi:lambda family phage tail tape measure protein [Hasllibacter halocynthiae]|uniref:Lambda family phage tail tape measure protein n=1 Tax=Hasllibacter halocynthiae TaxID=595589 RepID=A0A2T0X8T9_9RHOB|nr:phage tail tape measure protein [Hasllibacter halocynthiae]PRY95362.1 lambda family phage tail tape measure protein [Hasllibacter halocynthiae]